MAGLTGCGGGVTGDVVAQVGGTPITRAAVDHWITVLAALASPALPQSGSVLPDPSQDTACIASAIAAGKRASPQGTLSGARPGAKCEQLYQHLKQQALEFLISTDWVLDEASELGLKLSSTELEQQILEFKRRQSANEAEFRQFLARTGETEADIALQARATALAPKITPRIEQENEGVSQAQVRSYYEEHPQRFAVPEERDLKIVRIPSEARALAAKAAIRSGESFAAVAKTMSVAQPIDTREALLLGLTPGFFNEKPINDAIFAAAANVLTGPVKISLGYYVFEVKAIRRAHQAPLTQVEGAIRNQLSAERRQNAVNQYDKQFSKTWAARTDCRPGYVVPLCKHYLGQ
jgi:parvulin-like peptidyl-prolyl isomerase